MKYHLNHLSLAVQLALELTSRLVNKEAPK